MAPEVHRKNPCILPFSSLQEMLKHMQVKLGNQGVKQVLLEISQAELGPKIIVL